MTDLFAVKSKRQQLKEFILSRNWTSTADVDRWGLQNFHIRARRDAQDMAEAGEIRRMTDLEKRRHLSNPDTTMGYWVRNDFC